MTKSIDESVYDDEFENDENIGGEPIEDIEIEDDLIISDDDLEVIIVPVKDDLKIPHIVDFDNNKTSYEDSDVISSKHTINRKHSLNYDSIFKGKKDDTLSEHEIDFSNSYNETFEVDKSSIYWYESVDNESYIKEKRIKERVYEVLANYTDINFLNSRRKPSRIDFNRFYFILKSNLQEENFTNIEIFNELSVYFSDNLFNMFKLLDKKWRNLIISELQEHVGKQPYSKEIMNRNIHLGTEVEFSVWDNQVNDSIHITGVVIETDYINSSYKIDSYEKVYEIQLSEITKILNNTKFRYNLNKLNNIDFL